MKATDPRNLHDALRRITSLLDCVVLDVNEYMDSPEHFQAPEYFEDVVEAAEHALYLVAWVRNEINGVEKQA